MDARRHDVFAALYRVADAPLFSPERLVEIEGPTAGDPAATLARWGGHIRDAAVVFVGDGAALYADTIAGRASPGWTVLPHQPLLAGTIGRMAVARAQRGDTIDPAAVHPLYVRRPDAEVDAREAFSTKDTRTRKNGPDWLYRHGSNWIIEPLTSPSEIDDVIAIEEASFTNPWTREMYLAELENPGVSFCYLARDPGGQVVGFCSFWRVADELHINNLAVLPARPAGGRGDGPADAMS